MLVAALLSGWVKKRMEAGRSDAESRYTSSVLSEASKPAGSAVAEGGWVKRRCWTEAPLRVSWPMYWTTTLGLEACERMVRVGKNQAASVRQLWPAMAWLAPSGPIQEPCGTPPAEFLNSDRVPSEETKSIRLSAVPRALRVIVPVSMSEPAVRVAVPVSVTSLIWARPVSAAMALVAKATA